MNVINLDRYELLKFLPSGTCAEIGVAKGRLSKIIIENNNPLKLYLIDAWKTFDLGYPDGNMVSTDEHEKRYQDVKDYFKNNKNITIVRELSVPAANTFNDGLFDWIYIDADHSYNGCLNDLTAYNNKVKDDGYILGHDFTPPGGKPKKGFGVNEAVEDFVNANGYILSGITNESKFASYIISKNNKSHQALVERVK